MKLLQYKSKKCIFIFKFRFSSYFFFKFYKRQFSFFPFKEQGIHHLEENPTNSFFLSELRYKMNLMPLKALSKNIKCYLEEIKKNR